MLQVWPLKLFQINMQFLGAFLAITAVAYASILTKYWNLLKLSQTHATKCDSKKKTVEQEIMEISAKTPNGSLS